MMLKPQLRAGSSFSEECPPFKHADRSAKWREKDREAVLSCLIYATCSVLLSLTNKLVFSRPDFDFPLSVLAFQSFFTVVFVRVGSATGALTPVPFDLDLAKAMWPVTILFAGMLGSSSRALRHCSVPVITIFKNLSVVAITVYERFVYSEPISWGIASSLGLMVFSSAVAATGDLLFSVQGYLWMTLNVLCTVAYLAAIRARLHTNASAMAKTFHNQLFSLALFAAGAVWEGELVPFLSHLLQQDLKFVTGFFATSILGLLINLSSFWCLRVTSGTTYSFVGASNKIPATILGHFFFSSSLTLLGWSGVVIGLSSGFVFAVAKEQQRRRRQANHSPAREDNDSKNGDNCNNNCNSRHTAPHSQVRV